MCGSGATLSRTAPHAVHPHCTATAPRGPRHEINDQVAWSPPIAFMSRGGWQLLLVHDGATPQRAHDFFWSGGWTKRRQNATFHFFAGGWKRVMTHRHHLLSHITVLQYYYSTTEAFTLSLCTLPHPHPGGVALPVIVAILRTPLPCPRTCHALPVLFLTFPHRVHPNTIMRDIVHEWKPRKKGGALMISIMNFIDCWKC